MTDTFTNPVYPGYFADPFVLPLDGAFYAYGTDTSREGSRTFEALWSEDLVEWTSLGAVLERIDDPHLTHYWAPEIAIFDGRPHLYYSVGADDVGHRIRVAVGGGPAGPFVDTGHVLTPDERFAIDPHVFQDEDGDTYLFYARDVLEGQRVGTALAVDRMLDPFTLAGEPRAVLFATGDWQLFLRDRPMYGQVYDWHTLEGPSVVKRAGRYFLTYSGGAWTGEGYGVSWAVADHPLGPWTEPMAGQPALLRGLPGRLLGPGHNSVVTGPDGGDWLVYHAWDPARTARRMCLDRVEFGPDGPRTAGPTADPQPRPG